MRTHNEKSVQNLEKYDELCLENPRRLQRAGDCRVLKDEQEFSRKIRKRGRNCQSGMKHHSLFRALKSGTARNQVERRVRWKIRMEVRIRPQRVLQTITKETGLHPQNKGSVSLSRKTT